MADESYQFEEYPDYPDLASEALEESDDLAEVLTDALHDDYADASPEELDEALENLFESMSPAESFSFAKALKQIQRGAGQVLSDPAFGQIAGSALPVAGGALGTLIGGPAGTVVGTSLGNRVAKALPKRTLQTAGRPVAGAATRSVAGGSAAAAKGLVLTQQPDVLKSLLALSLGKHGKKSINGVPVAAIMNMLSSVFGQAAADADQLMFVDQEVADSPRDGAYLYESLSTADRSIYTTLIDTDNAELAEAMESL